MIATIQEYLTALLIGLVIPAIPLGIYSAFTLYPVKDKTEKGWHGIVGGLLVAIGLGIHQTFALWANNNDYFSSINWPWQVGISYRLFYIIGTLFVAWSTVQGNPGSKFWVGYVLVSLFIATVIVVT